MNASAHDPPQWFCTTHWSVVLAARGPGSPAATTALEQLCRAYWYPLYAFVRRRGHDEEDAKDLTQGFFSRLLEHGSLESVDREKGRFRSFLLAGMRHYLANEWDRVQSRKRGGGTVQFSLDAEAPEDRYGLEPVDEVTPERLFERRWAHAVLGQVVARLEAEQDDAERRERFAALQPFLLRQPQATGYEAVAHQLGLSVPAVTSAIHRLRLRFRELFRSEIAHTVSTPAQVDAEIRYLVQVLSEPEPEDTSVRAGGGR